MYVNTQNVHVLKAEYQLNDYKYYDILIIHRERGVKKNNGRIPRSNKNTHKNNLLY